MPRVLVTGSRDWENRDAIRQAFLGYDSVPEETLLVSGACPTGADAIAEEIAAELGWSIERHPANWNFYGKRAGFVRNSEMVKAGADVCFAFIRNESKGASMTASLAEKADIPTRRVVQ